MYSPWSSPLLAPWSLLPNSLGSMLGLYFPSSATHFLWLLLCLEPSDWRTEKGKEGMETCSHSANHCSSGQAKWFSPSLRTLAACSSPQLPHYCLWRGWKEGKKETKTGIPPAPSLWSLGVPLFLGSETEDFTWSSLCQPLVHTSEFLAAFGCRLGNTGGKEMANSPLAELWILVSFPDLRATVYVSGPSESCSVHSVQDL